MLVTTDAQGNVHTLEYRLSAYPSSRLRRTWLRYNLEKNDGSLSLFRRFQTGEGALIGGYGVTNCGRD